MSARGRSVRILGPQYHRPNLGEVFSSLDLPSGPIAVVTAGWQEREGEDEELDRHLDGRSLDLELYRRADRVFRNDPDFTSAHRDMQRMLREIERLYAVRLSYVRESIFWLLKEEGEERLVEPEREHAMQQLRELDAWHLERIVEVRGEFERKWRPLEREAVAREREEVAKLLREAPAVVITGGHVAVLLNRLRLFGIKELTRDKTIIAWSAGAMVLTERVVLFHDHPPQGAGNAEVMEEGLGICPRLVALPDGRKRLDLDDPHRISLFARRFEPACCVVLGDSDCISWDGERYRAEPPALRLSADGGVEEVRSW